MFDYYKPSLVKLALNLWPPFLGSGIKMVSISDDFHYMRLQLKKANNEVVAQITRILYVRKKPQYWSKIIS